MNARVVVTALLMGPWGAQAAEPWHTQVVVAGPERVVVTTDGVERMGRGYLGIDLVDLTPELRVHFGAPDNAGVLVARVEPDGPAAKGGLKVGDVLVAVDATELGSTWDMIQAIRPRTPGEPVALAVMRAKRAITLSVILGERTREVIWVGEPHDGELEFGDDVHVVVRDAIDRALLAAGESTWPEADAMTPDEIARFEAKMILLETRIRELEAELARKK